MEFKDFADLKLKIASPSSDKKEIKKQTRDKVGGTDLLFSHMLSRDKTPPAPHATKSTNSFSAEKTNPNKEISKLTRALEDAQNTADYWRTYAKDLLKEIKDLKDRLAATEIATRCL